jgi:hypothetical protein
LNHSRQIECFQIRTPHSAIRNTKYGMSFVANGSPPVVARAIEECATAQGNVTAIVVPWESDPVTLSMAVTSSRTDGWAIEHTNLGTITLTDLGNDATQVAIVSHEPDHPERQNLVALFERFARHVQNRLQPAS